MDNSTVSVIPGTDDIEYDFLDPVNNSTASVIPEIPAADFTFVTGVNPSTPTVIPGVDDIEYDFLGQVDNSTASVIQGTPASPYEFMDPDFVSDTVTVFSNPGEYVCEFMHSGASVSASNISGTYCDYDFEGINGSQVQQGFDPATLGKIYYSDFANAVNTHDIIEISDVPCLRFLEQYVENGNNCSGKTFILTSDITLTGTWTSIGNSTRTFRGNFNGNGRTISNMTVNSSDSYVGMFGSVGGSACLKNIALTNVSILGDEYVGMLAGQASCTVYNCYATGTVTGTNNEAGGLVGNMTSDTVSQVFFSGSVTGTDEVGGIAGVITSSSVSDSYALGGVHATAGYAGGVAGQITNSNMTSTHAYNIATGGVNATVGGYTAKKTGGSFTDCNFYDPDNYASSTGNISVVTKIFVIPESARQGVALSSTTTLADLNVEAAGFIVINDRTINLNINATIDDIVLSINNAGAGVIASLSGGNIYLKSDANGSITVEDGVIANALGLSNSHALAGSYQTTTNRINPDEAILSHKSNYNLGGQTIQEGTFIVKGKTISITNDTTLTDVINSINSSGANVVASFDAGENKFYIRGYNSNPVTIIDGTGNFASVMGFAKDVTAYETNYTNTSTATIRNMKANMNSVIYNNDTDFAYKVTAAGTFKINGHTFEITQTTTLGQLMNSVNNAGIGVRVDYNDGILKFISTDGNDLTMEKGTSDFTDLFGLTHAVERQEYSRNATSFSRDVVFDLDAKIVGNSSLFVGNETVTRGTFYINGVEFNINANTTLKSLINEINTNDYAFAHAEIATVGNEKKLKITSAHPVDKDVTIIGGISNFTNVMNLTHEVEAIEEEKNQILGAETSYLDRASLSSKLVGNKQFKAVVDDELIKEGYFTINGVNFTINNETKLGQLIDDINNSDAGVIAYWNSQTDRMTFTSKTEGKNLIHFADGTSNFLSIMRVTDENKQILGTDGYYSFIGGQTIISNINTITSDLTGIDGLTINLQNVSKSNNNKLTSDKLSVTNDTSYLEASVVDFVNMYNELVTELDSVTGTTGLFHNDVGLKSLTSQLKNTVNSSYSNGSEYKLLSQIGVKTAAPGASLNSNTNLLSVDINKLHNTIVQNSAEVKKFMLGTNADFSNGVMTRLNNLIFTTMSAKGFFATRNSMYGNQISRYETLINATKTRWATYRSSLETKFSSMEKLISDLQTSYSKMSGTIGANTASVSNFLK